MEDDEDEDEDEDEEKDEEVIEKEQREMAATIDPAAVVCKDATLQGAITIGTPRRRRCAPAFESRRELIPVERAHT